jgi:hypothetical protein
MNVSKKIILVSLSGIILLGVVALFLSVNSLQKRGAAEAAFARSMMLDEKKGKLQDLIKSTYAIIQSHYDYAHDPDKVAATYRQQLKSIVDVAYKTVEQVTPATTLMMPEKSVWPPNSLAPCDTTKMTTCGSTTWVPRWSCIPLNRL